MKQFVIYLLGLIFWLAAPAASAQKQVADSLYAAEKFQQAAAEYEKLLKESDNAELYYNLGNAYYRLHDIGHAILNYEKASNREPGVSWRRASPLLGSAPIFKSPTRGCTTPSTFSA